MTNGHLFLVPKATFKENHPICRSNKPSLLQTRPMTM